MQQLTEPQSERKTFASEKMNGLLLSTVNTLALLHPHMPHNLKEIDHKIGKSRERIAEYREKVAGFYNKENHYDVLVTKTLIMLHYLDTLAIISARCGGFDNMFDPQNTPNPFVAGLFYNDISRNHRQKMLTAPVSESGSEQKSAQEFAKYLLNISKRYIPENRLNQGDFSWLEDGGIVLGVPISE